MIVVYGLRLRNISDPIEVINKGFTDAQLSEALAYCRKLRDEHCINVVLSSEPGNMIGGFGVDAVENGLTPSGEQYTWSKQHRGGPPRT